MSSTLTQLEPKALWKHFADLCAIPRPSRSEERARAHVKQWAKGHGYEYMRFEGLNRHKPMLHLALGLEFDIVGTRWDSVRSDLLIQFEKTLGEVPA